MLWSAKLVDTGIGQNNAKTALGHDARTTPIGGLLSGAVSAFYGAAISVLQSLANMLIMALLFAVLTMLGRGWLVRWMTARPGRIARVTAAMLLTVGVFTVVYWTIRVPAIFGYGRFPTMPYNN